MKIMELTVREAEAVRARADELRREIDAAEDPVRSGPAVYLSADGDDGCDGRTPDTAWKNLDRLKKASIAPGTSVLFRRGDIWRGSVEAQASVTYGAYGSGEKPRLYGSPFDGAKTGSWTEVCPHVWRYSEKMEDDCGGIVFDGGPLHGRKVTVSTDGPVPVDTVTREPFRGYFDLTGDLSFWHDLGKDAIRREGGGTLYLRSETGNPAERFGEIEFMPRVHGISVHCDNVTVDNLCLMYYGAHGIAAGTVNGLHVTNTVLGWIGGGLQYVRNGRPVRFGNGVEIYGGCRDYRVERCHVFQCYDAGLTFQYSSGGGEDILMDGVTFRDCLIEDCSYSVEYFLGKADRGDADRQMKNILISGCVMRGAGCGWGVQRPDRLTPAHLKAWDHFNRRTGEFVAENNIFDRSRHMMLHVAAEREEWLPLFRNNLFVQYPGADLGRIGPIPTAMLPYAEDAVPERLAENNAFRSVNTENG